jgi:hypothetical protein
MFRRRVFFTVGLSVLGIATFACGHDDEAPPPIVGVNDVSKACAIRAQWTRASSPDCDDCMALAPIPKCACSSAKDYAGKCSDQQQIKTNEPTCTGVGECVFKCAANDCACVDACYAAKDACRVRASALDGCLAEACDNYCR